MTTIHPLVTQLRFTRSEFARAFEGVSDEDGAIRTMPLNCIAWTVGHLAWQEQRYFLIRAQLQDPLLPEINTEYAYGAPASTPRLSDTRTAWQSITSAADPYLDTVTSHALQQLYRNKDGSPGGTTMGNLLLRTMYHYWYHLGEIMAMRQMLGHTDMPEFVGDIDDLAPYSPEV